MKFKFLILFILLICQPIYASVTGDAQNNTDSDRIHSTARASTTTSTFSMWVKMAAFPASTNRAFLSTYAELTGAWTAWDKTLFVDSNGKAVFYIFDGAEKLATSTSTLTLGTWFHVAGSTDGTNIRVYVNGALEATTLAGTSFNAWATGPRFNMLGIDAFANVWVAASATIEEVAYWSVKLSDNEVAQLASSRLRRIPLQIQPLSLAGYYPIDDYEDGAAGNGKIFLDYSGNGRHGTGDDGQNNTGLTVNAGSVLSYP